MIGVLSSRLRGAVFCVVFLLCARGAAGVITYPCSALPPDSSWTLYEGALGSGVTSQIVGEGSGNYSWKLSDQSTASDTKVKYRNVPAPTGAIDFDLGTSIAARIKCADSPAGWSGSNFNFGINKSGVGGVYVGVRPDGVSLYNAGSTSLGSWTRTADYGYHTYILTIRNETYGSASTIRYRVYVDGILRIDRTGVQSSTTGWDGYVIGHSSSSGVGTWYFDWVACRNDGAFGPTQWNPASAPDPEDRVLVTAHYYPWWYPSRWRYTEDYAGYLGDILSVRQPPLLGEYDTGDLSVINQQIIWCAEHNIDVWTLEWYGGGSNDEDARTVLNSPYIGDIKFCIFYDWAIRFGDFAIDSARISQVVSDFNYLASTYFGHPSYLTLGGRKPVYMYASHALSGDVAGMVSAVRAAVAARGYDVYLIADLLRYTTNWTSEEARAAPYDAIFSYGYQYGESGGAYADSTGMIARFFSRTADYQTHAYGWGKDLVPSIAPGYNDRAVRRDNFYNIMPLQRRSGGGYTSLLDGVVREVAMRALECDARMFAITSFNEWHEGTNIEPATRTGMTNKETASASGTDYTGGFSYMGHDLDFLRTIRDATASYFGRVRSGGLALSGATVEVTLGGEVVSRCRSTTTGAFCASRYLTGVGTYDVRASAPGMATATASGAVCVAAHSASIWFNLSATGPYATIRGRVTERYNAMPVEGASILAGGAEVASTDKDGRYVCVLPAGDYDVWALRSGFASPTQVSCSLAGGSEAVVDFQLPPNPYSVYCRLRSINQSSGLSQAAFSDGDTTVEVKGDLECRRTGPGADDYYLYAAVSDTFLAGGRPYNQAHIVVDYFDEGTDTFVVDYDSSDPALSGTAQIYKSTSIVAKTNSKTWKRAVFAISDAYFGNRQNGPADLRVNDRGDGDEYIARIAVSKGNRASAWAVPSGVSATGLSTSEVSVAWSAPSDIIPASGYVVRRNGAIVGTTPNMSFVDGGLPANTAYFYTVEAQDAYGSYSGESAAAWGCTLSVAPSAANVACDRAVSRWYTDNPFTFTAVGGFGPGRIARYGYCWNDSPTHAWTGAEPTWSPWAQPPASGWTLWPAENKPGDTGSGWTLIYGGPGAYVTSDTVTDDDGSVAWRLVDNSTSSGRAVYRNSGSIYIDPNTGVAVSVRMRPVPNAYGFPNPTYNFGINSAGRGFAGVCVTPSALMLVDLNNTVLATYARPADYSYHTYTLTARNARKNDGSSIVYTLYQDGRMVGSISPGISTNISGDYILVGSGRISGAGEWRFDWVAYRTGSAGLPPEADASLLLWAAGGLPGNYLHVRGYNLHNLPNGTLDMGPYLIGSPASSVVEAESRADGSSVALVGKVVSAAFAGRFYIQEADRTAAIGVISSTEVAEGTAVSVAGVMTTESGERFIDARSGKVQTLP